MHPAQQQLLEYFENEHLPAGRMRGASEDCRILANGMVSRLGDTEAGAELTTGLRKLLEAKDCFVRAAMKMPPART